MKLKKLISHLPVKVYRGSLEVEITGICSNSKIVAPGNLFIAKKGDKDDGGKYLDEALAAGAVAFLTDMPNPFIKGAVQLVHPTPGALESLIASRFYDAPSESLYCIGITGTNGKTTTSFLIRHLFEELNFPCGLIGTIEYIIGKHHFEADKTTPDAITCQKLLREMVKQGCNSAVMEVSSHALAQNRCDHIKFDTAIFTNLTQDHLDYHITLEQYAAQKAKLFAKLEKGQTAIVNQESPWKEKMVANSRASVFTYGFSPNCDLYATDIVLNPRHTEFTVHYQGLQVQFQCDLIGRYNVLNCLAAIAVCLIRQIPLAALPPLMRTFAPVPGRLERVDNLRGLNLFVDYAHTPDALEQVLGTLKEMKQGRLITVFGCGGDRDRAKRPLMGKVAERGSDFTIVTSDNPRSEDPQTICTQIAAGFQTGRHCVILDRRRAIEHAIGMAEQQDLILIAGKGHETYQLFAHQTIPFDDRKIAQEVANFRV